MDTYYRVMDLFASVLHVNLMEHQIDNLYWIGKRKHNRPSLIKFTSTLTKDYIMERASMFKGYRIRLQDDYNFETQLKRRQLVIYIWQARGRGKHAVLEGDELKINEVLFDLEFCEKNFTNGAENSSMRGRAVPLQGLNFQSERKRKDKDTHQGEEKLEELAVKDNIMKPTEQQGKTFKILAQSQVGQSKDNLDSQEGAKNVRGGFLKTISRGRREDKFGCNWTLQKRQTGINNRMSTKEG